MAAARLRWAAWEEATERGRGDWGTGNGEWGAGRKRRLKPSVPAPRLRFRPLVERKAWWWLSDKRKA